MFAVLEGEGGAGGEFFLDVGEEGGFLIGGDGAGGFLVEAEHLLRVAMLGEADEADFGSGGAIGALERGRRW